MHLALSHVTLSNVTVSHVPLLPALLGALLILAIAALMQRRRRDSGGRGSSAPRMNSRLGVAPNPRVAAKRRLAAVPSGPFAAAQSITAAQPFVAAQPFEAAPRLVVTQTVVTQTVAAPQPFAVAPQFAPAPTDLFVAQPDPRLEAPFESPPEAPPAPHVEVPEAVWSVGPVASVSVLAALTEGDKARPSFAPSNSGDAFPTRARALSLIGGQLLAALGIAAIPLASTPIGHHASHLAHISVVPVALLCVLLGFVLVVVPTARIQHDIMGGGWYPGFPIRYISPETARYVISPSGISAAALRVNVPAWRVILVEYGLVAASVLVVLDRYVAR